MGLERTAEISRKTAETDISLSLNVDGAGNAEVSTGLGFYNHMLEAFARHGRFDLQVAATGDLDVDANAISADAKVVHESNWTLPEKRGECRFIEGSPADAATTATEQQAPGNEDAGPGTAARSDHALIQADPLALGGLRS